MMEDFYSGKWIKIRDRLSKIKSPGKGIEYLLIERRDFVDSNTIDDVDSKHFLMKLDNEIEIINIRERSIAKSKSKERHQLTLRKIALIHFYDKNLEHITRGNADDIAAEFGFKSKTSGERLYHHYSYYSSKANRKGKPDPFTIVKLNNKIKLFEDVIELLPSYCKSDAISDLNSLKHTSKEE